MTSDSVRPPEQRYGYSNALTGLVALVKEEGIKGLGRGLGTNVARATLMTVSQMIILSQPTPEQHIIRHPKLDRKQTQHSILLVCHPEHFQV